MPVTLANTLHPLDVYVNERREYSFWIYESNLFNTDIHPITGLATDGIHTPVIKITQATNRKISILLDKPGSVSFDLPLSSPEATEIIAHEIKRCVVVYYRDLDTQTSGIAFTGPIFTTNISSSGDSDTLSVSAVGWFQLLYNRELRTYLNFNQFDAGLIAKRLLGSANAQIANNNTVGSSTVTVTLSSGIQSGSMTACTGPGPTVGDIVSAGSAFPNGAVVTGIVPNTINFSQPSSVSGSTALTITSVQNGENIIGDAGELNTLENMFFGIGSRPDTGSPYIDTSYPFLTTLSIMPTGNGGVAISNTALSGTRYTGLSPNFFDANQVGGVSNLPVYIPVSPSTTYAIKSLINISSQSGSPKVGVTVQWNTIAGVQISVVDLLVSGSINIPFILSQTLTSPSNAAYAVIYLPTQSNGGSVIATWQFVQMSKTNVGTVPSPIGMGIIDFPAEPSGTTRTRSYQAGQKIGNAIEELSQIESGFDFQVANVTEGLGNGAITIHRELNVTFQLVKAATTIYGIGQDRPDVIVGLNWGPNNLESLEQSTDGSQLANRITGRSTTRSARSQDMTSIGNYGLWEDTVNISDAGVTDTVIAAYAAGEVVYRAAPLKLWNPVILPIDGKNDLRVPRVFVDYNVGDIVYLVADKNVFQVGKAGSGQAIRIFGITINLDNEGNEFITDVKTTASS